MRTLSLREIVGLFIFGLFGFLLYLFGVGLIHKAWTFLVSLIETGSYPTELLQMLFIQANPLGIAGLHDIGIFLASLGIIVLYIIYFVWLLPLGIPERSRRGFQYILGFLLVFAAWIGIWICMHRAFLFLLEFWRGYLPDPTWSIGIVQLTPNTLHVLGLILVGLFLLGTLLVLLYKAYVLVLASHTISETRIDQSTKITAGNRVAERIGWPIPFIQIKKDWKFYFLAFLPYFSAAFAVWILLFEGFVAQLYGIPILWALIPSIPWTPDYYMIFGGGLLLTSMLALWGIIVFIRRAPATGMPGNSWWWQGTRRFLFVILTITVIVSLSVGLIIITWTYLQLGTLIPVTALLWQQIGETSVLLGLVAGFIIIVGERASEV
jgi:hypothetical protein